MIPISRRVSKLRVADQGRVIQGGRVPEQATLEAFVQPDGSYADLFALQARGQH